jgi:hypothetical protein
MPSRPTKARRQCTYRENGRRCPFPFEGTGNPPLCRAHQIAIAEAARPRRPVEVVADAFVNFMQGRPINAEATIGAVDSLIGQWSGSNYHPDVGAGETEESVHRRDRGRGQRPWWAPGPAEGPGTDGHDQRKAELVARQVMGFTASEVLDADQIKDRKKTLAKRVHPDRPGGSTEKMIAVNHAADVLLQALDK